MKRTHFFFYFYTPKSKNLDTQVAQELVGALRDSKAWCKIKNSGLVLPPCFTELPNDLILNILESLPGVDIARVSCVSSKLRKFMGSSDDLWKLKYVEKFGDGAILGEAKDWKEKFAKSMGMKVINRRVAIVRGPTSITGTLDATYTWQIL